MKYKIKIYTLYLLIFTFLIVSSLYFTIEKNDLKTNAIITEKNNKTAYLTFDDGPSKNTDKILNILDKYNIKATFFVVGPSYKLKNDYLKKIVENGHQIAIHSYNHNYNQIYSSKENYIKDFNECLNWIKNTTGITPSIYRFPGGSSNTIANKDLIKSIIKDLTALNFEHTDWNVDTLDSYSTDYKKIIENALTSIKKNENNNNFHQTILMHDDIKKSATITALPLLIEKLISLGYHFEILTKEKTLVKHIKL